MKIKRVRAKEVDFLKKNNDVFCNKGKAIFRCVECDQGIYDSKAYMELPLIEAGVTSHFKCPSCGTFMAMIYDDESETFMVIDDAILFKDEDKSSTK